jgi:hypothetical protein
VSVHIGGVRGRGGGGRVCGMNGKGAGMRGGVWVVEDAMWSEVLLLAAIRNHKPY